MGDFLEAILPRYFPTLGFRVISFQGKHDLLDNMHDYIANLGKSLLLGWYIFVLVDRDQDDCYELKARLERISREAGLTTRGSALGQQWQVVNRIVIEELEAWYFGDWEAVCLAYGRDGEKLQSPKFRDPDEIKGGTWEAFERVMETKYRLKIEKREAARKIGAYIEPSRSSSRSFGVFWEAVSEAAA